MCSANAKPAALSRLWATLTRGGVKAGLHPPVMFTSRRSSAVGCNGAATTADPCLRQNIDTQTTEALILDRSHKATDKSLRSLYQRKHMILSRGRFSDA